MILNLECHLRLESQRKMTSKLLIIASILAISNAFSLRTKSPDIASCLAGTENFIENIVVDVTPWPIHIQAGTTVSIDVGVDILQAIVEGSNLKLDLKLITPLGKLPIPCIPVRIMIMKT